MQKILKSLQENPVVCLSTIGLDRKSKVRAMRFSFEDDGRLWFCTDNRNNTFQELKKF